MRVPPQTDILRAPVIRNKKRAGGDAAFARPVSGLDRDLVEDLAYADDSLGKMHDHGALVGRVYRNPAGGKKLLCNWRTRCGQQDAPYGPCSVFGRQPRAIGKLEACAKLEDQRLAVSGKTPA